MAAMPPPTDVCADGPLTHRAAYQLGNGLRELLQSDAMSSADVATEDFTRKFRVP